MYTLPLNQLKMNILTMTDPSMNDIAEILRKLANNNKVDSDRLAKQEANNEHLALAIEKLTESNTTYFKDLNEKTGNLTLAIEKIALNERHTEKLMFKQLSDLKDDYLQSRGDIFASTEKIELSLRDHSHRLTSLEMKNATKRGEDNASERSRNFWNLNGVHIIVLGLASIPFLAALYNLVKGK